MRGGSPFVAAGQGWCMLWLVVLDFSDLSATVHDTCGIEEASSRYAWRRTVVWNSPNVAYNIAVPGRMWLARAAVGQPRGPHTNVCGLVAMDVTQARSRLRAHCIVQDAASGMPHTLRHTARCAVASLQAQSPGATNFGMDSLPAGHVGHMHMHVHAAAYCAALCLNENLQPACSFVSYLVAERSSRGAGMAYIKLCVQGHASRVTRGLFVESNSGFLSTRRRQRE